MSDFDDLRRELTDAKAGRSAARRDLFVAHERLRAIGRRRDRLTRGGAGPQELDVLAAEEREQAARVDRLTARDRAAADGLIDGLVRFEQFADPTENVSRLDDSTPILLLPLRIETRFKELTEGDRRLQQLWVRVYPDDIAVNTFEEVLAEVEISNARIYWTNVWKAGSNDGGKRAAWQSLAKSHGAGRAHWIIQRVAPLNPADEPVVGPGEHLLVIVTDRPLPAAERDPARTYWRAVFLAAEQSAIDDAFDALVASVGATRADKIAAEYAPQNLATPAPAADPPLDVRVEFLDLPDQAAIDSQQLPWMRAADTAVLPERLVVMGFNGSEQTLMEIGRPIPAELSIGPNPSAPQEDQLRVEDGELIVPEPMRWMTDFDVAVANGMGFRIDLTPVQARAGFDRLFVLGVRLSSDPQTGAAELEALLADHQRSRKGLSLLAQGAPTNNVEDDVSGYTWREDTDVSYDHYFGTAPTDPDDWRDRTDGRWLADLIGIDAEVLKASPNYFGTDQREARAMNEALWPTTFGYLLDQMMESVFDDDAVTSTRAWFNRYVVGRGTLPAIRVGRQPYGILPATPYSRMGWINRKLLAGDLVDTGIPGQFRFLDTMYRLVRAADGQWTQLAGEVSYVGKPGVDPHQALLDVVGLHPSSVEYYQRYAETAEQLYNRFKLSGNGAAFLAALVAMGYVTSGMQLLEQLGYQPGDEAPIPEILDKLFLDQPNLLKGPVVDDVPLSETNEVRAYRSDQTNYLQWLVAAARQSHDTVRRQEGFVDDRPPTALLYLMLRHALDIGYVATGIQFHVDADLLDRTQARAALREPKFVHIQDAQVDTGSPWRFLYQAQPVITGDPQLTIGEFIPTVLTLRNPYLNTQIEAIERLQHAPTARLERAFAEHVDCCTNRLDAWWLGLVNVQLEVMRTLRGTADAGGGNGDGADGDEGDDVVRRGGCYLGAYGWVEDLRPDHRVLQPVELPPELQPIFDKPGQAPLGIDAHSFGYIHAPSLDHAVTAAVLRNGYLANATPSNPDSLSVNLSSHRVRLAMGVIEGMRNGQSLGALLGYQLERGLHDRPGLFLDSVIFELRGRFPLVANRFNTTRVTDGAIQAVEARNVVDGLALVQHVAAQTGDDRLYPWGLDDDLPDIADATSRAAIDAEVARIADINDAVADLAMAESVYQVVRGNYDRAASTLDAYSKGNFPPIPEVVQTPRSGVTLTHRVGIHLRAGLDPDDAANATPRAKGEPAVNAFLEARLPATDTIFCLVDISDAGPAGDRTIELTAADLGLLPIDLLYAFHRDGEQDMAAIDDVVVRHVVVTESPRPDAGIRIRYRDRQDGKCSMFELAPLIADLHDLLLRSRPLKATDTRLPNEARTTEEDTATVRLVKITRVRDLLDIERGSLEQYVTDIATLLDDPSPEIAVDNAIDNIDTLIEDYAAIADAMNRFGLPGAGLGFAWDWRRRAFGDLAGLLDELLLRWDTRLTEYDQRITDFPGLAGGMSIGEQIAYLLDAGLLISTAVIVPPSSGDPQDLLDALTLTTRPAFVTQRAALAAIVPGSTTVTGLLRAIEGELAAVALHDPAPPDVGEHRTAIVAFAATLRSKAESLLADITSRIDAADADVLAAATASTADAVELLTGALRRLTNPDFVVLPEFTLGSAHAAEWQAAYDDRAALLTYLQNDLGVDFPVDDWTYGVARVREKMQRLEGATMLTEALTGGSIGLEPLQFPRRSDDAWLALRFPDVHPVSGEPFVIDEDKLLYTAHYPSTFLAGGGLHCGVLVDEWTEVIPRTEETTGVAFHYDRPSNEAPQTLLLALPADFTGSWDWDDLVDTLHETLDMARKRAVEPRHVDTTAYARFLPATLSSVTRYPILQMLDLAFNNAVQFATD